MPSVLESNDFYCGDMGPAERVSELTLSPDGASDPTVRFQTGDGEIIGTFIVGKDGLRFEGNADESARVFIDAVLSQFNAK